MKLYSHGRLLSKLPHHHPTDTFLSHNGSIQKTRTNQALKVPKERRRKSKKGSQPKKRTKKKTKGEFSTDVAL